MDGLGAARQDSFAHRGDRGPPHFAPGSCPVPRAALDELYQLRWGVETYFDHFKNQLDVPRWNSTKLNGILQELYASLFVSTLGNILGRPLTQQLHQPRSPPLNSTL